MLAITGTFVVGCGDDVATPPSLPTTLSVTPPKAFLETIGATVQLTAVVLDQHGDPMEGIPIAWTTGNPDVAEVNRTTGRVTAVGDGIATITATAEGISGAAEVEVASWEPYQGYIPGHRYYGRNRYVEYIAGDLPLVVSAPHGGDLEPGEIPDRTWGTTVTDRNTEEVARALFQAIWEPTGRYPHVIICHLRRTKLDANREIQEAAQGNPYAERAWREYHEFIENAKEEVEDSHGRGFFVDLHGHGHAIPRLELGYLLRSSELELPDSVLSADPAFREKSSIRTLAERVSIPFAELLRGPTSLGTLLEAGGYPSVPSASQPDPGGAAYFTGGYNTRRHGSRDGGPISGVQIEMNHRGVRDTQAVRQAFAQALRDALEAFFQAHYELTW